MPEFYLENIYFTDVMSKADDIYGARKGDYSKVCESDQIRALCEALVGAVNEKLREIVDELNTK